MTRRLLSALLLFSASVAVAEVPEKKLDLVIADTRVVGANEALGTTVTTTLADHATKLGFHARTHDDLRKLAQYEQVKQAFGCGAEDCDATKVLATAVNADRLLVPTLAQVGDARILSLVLFDTTSGRVLRRTSRESIDDAQVLEAGRDAVQLLLTGADRPTTIPRVAVLPFDDNTKNPELAPLRKGLADMLISDLGRSDGVQLVERDRLEELLSELKRQGTKAVDPATAVKVGKLVGAQFLVLGSYLEVLGSLRLDARIVKVETGVIVATGGVNGKRDDFFDLEAKLAATLATGLGTKVRASLEPKEPANAADALEYAKVLELLDAGRRTDAGDALRKLTTRKPGFKPALKLASRAGI